ncbi:hypothetical protein SARC_13395 [Sphaeroforma arctica JP610]|uniref:Uncharacterized protein n=1 Tax=Sphaeroforma arctica JP610 TaxID=667725 RepID=A0A0L0FBD0_9EUKA|nr:hypothetical protein SARC_13395 [Sphaeroforma arctica JP610]KNC74047.1 hypothetical protein SARC_13395 [Sphaeroforma arctica JP610]|eukprot:XP_014147949.1 hypothetical protein SARC_13395 [Sphaeroforma arctica JP610]
MTKDAEAGGLPTHISHRSQDDTLPPPSDVLVAFAPQVGTQPPPVASSQAIPPPSSTTSVPHSGPPIICAYDDHHRDVIT